MNVSEFQYEKFKSEVINHFEKKGLKNMGEFLVLSGIPIVVAYKIILDHTDSIGIKHKCNIKLKAIHAFYNGM